MKQPNRNENARIEKDDAREPGDKFMSSAKALKLLCCRAERRTPTESGLVLHVLAEDRNRYRQMIDDAVTEAIARRVGVWYPMKIKAANKRI